MSRFLRLGVKPGSHMPPNHLGHSLGQRWGIYSLGQRCGICEHLAPTQSVPGIDRRLAFEVELSSTSQANRRLSAMKIFYVNIICGHLRRYAATKSRVGRRHMKTRLRTGFQRGRKKLRVTRPVSARPDRPRIHSAISP